MAGADAQKNNGLTLLSVLLECLAWTSSALSHTPPLIKHKTWEWIFSRELRNWLLGFFLIVSWAPSCIHTQKHTVLHSYTFGMWGTILRGCIHTYKIHHRWNIALQKEGRTPPTSTQNPFSLSLTHTEVHFTLATCWLDTGRGLQTELLVTGTTLSERDERRTRSAEDWAAALHTLNDENIKNTRHDTWSKAQTANVLVHT